MSVKRSLDVVNPTLFNGIADAVFVYLLNGTTPECFIEVNTAACELLGYTRQELIHMTPYDLTDAQGKSIAPEYAKRFLEERNIVFEWSYVRKNGQVIDVEIHSNVVVMGDKTFVVSTCRDLSRCRRIQREASLTSEQYISLHENMQNAIFSIQHDGTFIDLNPAAEKLLGCDKSVFIGQSMFDYIVKSRSVEDCLHWIQEAMSGISKEKKMMWRDVAGNLHTVHLRAIPFVFNETVIGIRGIVQDVTTETELKQNLYDVERRLQSILQSVRLFLWSYDVRESRYSYCTENVKEVLGVPVSRITGQTIRILDRVHPEDRRRVHDAFEFAKQGSEMNIDFRLQLSQRGEMWVRTVARARKDALGQVIQIDGVTMDIHQEKIFGFTSQLHQRRFEGLLNLIPDGIVLHQAGVIRYANEAARQMVRLSQKETLIGVPIWTMVHPDSHGEGMLRYERLMSDGQYGVPLPPVEQKIVRQDASTFPAESRSVLVNDEGIPSILTVVKDITHQKAMSAELEYQAYHDDLTGIANRRGLMRYMNELLRTSGTGSTHSIFLLDLDRFKYLNDLHGHTFGDEALKMVTKRLQAIAMHPHFLARIGGDEFVMVCSDMNDEQIEQIVSGILGNLSMALSMKYGEFRLAPSVGIAIYPRDGQDIDVLLKRADVAMYQAKARGGRQAIYFQSAFEQKITERVQIEQELEQALVHHEFFLEYQPKVRIKDGRICAVEALVRWQTEGGELRAPDKFIPIAEETGFIVALGHWVLEEACRQSVAWWATHGRRVVVSVNVSPKQFEMTDMYQVIVDTTKRTQLPPQCLTIEITEGIMMNHSGEIAETLKRIRRLGVNVAIDDFGTGYSSLRYLRYFEPTHLKIDRSFISNMLEDNENMGIVTAIIQLAHTLGAAVVAEGVETEEQWLYLKSAGCDIAQGFLFSKPVAPDALVSRWFPRDGQT